MKVIFLDFDGVVNSDEFFDALKSLTRMIIAMNHPSDAIDEVAVARVERIAAATGAVIVISSSWRYGYHTTQLRGFLYHKGLTAKIIGRTPMSNELDPERVKTLTTCDEERGLEIMTWLEQHPEVETYVVLDDNPVGLEPESRRVATTWKKGLLDEHVDQAIQILSR
jgi:hypothetical protein